VFGVQKPQAALGDYQLADMQLHILAFLDRFVI